MAKEFLPIFKQLSAWGGKHKGLSKREINVT
jgi:hypothetical protein